MEVYLSIPFLIIKWHSSAFVKPFIFAFSYWLMLSKCGAEGDSWESLGQQGDQTRSNQINPKGNEPWIVVGRTDAEAEATILWPLDAKNWLIGKDPDAGKDWGQKEKGTTEDEMVGWHHWLNGHEFEQTLWDSEGQGSLACCSPWGCKELDTTVWLTHTYIYTTSVARCWSSDFSRNPTDLKVGNVFGYS